MGERGPAHQVEVLFGKIRRFPENEGHDHGPAGLFGRVGPWRCGQGRFREKAQTLPLPGEPVRAGRGALEISSVAAGVGSVEDAIQLTQKSEIRHPGIGKSAGGTHLGGKAQDITADRPEGDGIERQAPAGPGKGSGCRMGR